MTDAHRTSDPRTQFPDPFRYQDIEAELAGQHNTIIIRDTTPHSQFPAVWMTLDEARAVRDWLNKVLR